MEHVVNKSSLKRKKCDQYGDTAILTMKWSIGMCIHFTAVRIGH
jgi:hypothetical protein